MELGSIETAIAFLAWPLCFALLYFFCGDYFSQGGYDFETGTPTDASNPDFSTPIPPRYTVSKSRYFFWFLVFFALVTIFTLVLWLAIQKSSVEDLNKISDSGWFVLLLKTCPQLLAALLVTGLVPNLPGAAQILQSLRAWCHKNGSIPHQAQRAYSAIKRGRLEIEDLDKRRAIAFAGPQALQMEDFDAPEQSLMQHWASACHLLNSVQELAHQPNYKVSLGAPELRYNLVRANFDLVRDNVSAARTAHEFREALHKQVERLLKQVAQLTVSVICASETRDRDIFRRIADLGVRLEAERKYDIHLSPAFLGCFVYFFLIFLICYFLPFPLPDQERRPGSFAGNSAALATLFFVFAVYVPLIAKRTFEQIWPVRGQFSKRLLPPIVFCFLIGTAAGGAMMYAVATFWPSVFTLDQLQERLPFSIILGLLTALMAALYDMRVCRPNTAIVLRRSIGSGLVTFVVSGLVAVVLILWVQANESLRAHAWVIFSTASVGGLAGLVGAVIAVYSIRPSETRRLRELNLLEYLVPVLEVPNIRALDDPALGQLFRDRASALSARFLAYLESEKLLDNEGRLTENGFFALRRVAGPA